MTKLEFNEENLSKEQIEQLENIVRESKKKKVWKPKYDDRVYYINIFANADYFTFENTESDLLAYNSGLIFETRGQAKFEIEKKKVEFEIKQCAEEKGDDIMGCQYYIFLDLDTKKIEIGSSLCVKDQGKIYFEYRKDCEDCIKQVGEDRIKKYIFGMEE